MIIDYVSIRKVNFGVSIRKVQHLIQLAAITEVVPSNGG